METIYKTKHMKYRHIHPNSVRAFLKKKGYRVGAWGSNGRISGMSDFYGGNVEVKENDITTKITNDYKKYETYAVQTTFIETVTNVEVKFWHSSDKVYGSVDGAKIARDLCSNGWSAIERKNSIIVDIAQ